jgi:hypothetical protein
VTTNDTSVTTNDTTVTTNDTSASTNSTTVTTNDTSGTTGGGQGFPTALGGSGDENLLAPSGTSQVFSLESAQTRNSFQNACNASGAAGTKGSERRWHRLTKNEYINTLRDLLTVLTDATSANSMMTQIQPKLNAIPVDLARDVSRKGLPTMDIVTGDEHAQAYHDVALALAPLLAAKKSQFIGSSSCNSSTTATCFGTFLDTKGHLFWRRSITPEEKAFALNKVFSVTGGGLTKALAALLMSPYFINHVEIENGYIDSSSTKVQVYNLSAWELASKLSYALWGTMPDETLFNAAKDSSINTNSVYEAQARRLLAGANAKRQLRLFVYEWLGLKDVPALDLTDPIVAWKWRQHTGAPSASGIDGAVIRDQAIAELQDLVQYYTFEAPINSRRFSGLLLSRLSNAGVELTQAIYQSTQPGTRGATSAGANWFRFGDADRRGIMGRAAFQLIDANNRRPVIRGIHTLDRILCRSIGLPADNSTPSGAVLRDYYSTRQKVEAITTIPGTACVSCHSTINPVGFAFEGYDGFGRKDMVEKILFPMNNNPTVPDAVADINASGSFDFIAGNASFDNAGEFILSAAESFEAHRCFSRFLWRFLNKRVEDISSTTSSPDACHIQAIYNDLEKADGLQKAILNTVLNANFKKRNREVQ